MKGVLKKVRQPQAIILAVYLTLAFSTEAFLYLGISRAFFLAFVLIAAAFALLSPFILELAAKISIKNNYSPEKTKQNRMNTVLLFTVAFLLFIVFYYSFYPGGFTTDSKWQYNMAVNNAYNDWHPFMHTVLAIKLPLVLTGGIKESIVFIQAVIFAVAAGYAFNVVLKYTNPIYALVTMLLALANPVTIACWFTIQKDSSLGICITLLAAYVLQIYFTQGEWIKRPINTAAFVIVLTVLTLIRHNAVLFTLPLLFAVWFYVSKKRAVVITLCFLVLIFGARVGLYNALNVQAPDKRQVETCGLPFNIISSVAANDYSAIDSETQEFLQHFTSREELEEVYEYGDFNKIKFINDRDNIEIEDYTAADILRITAKCIKASPEEALKGFIKTTNAIYSPAFQYGWTGVWMNLFVIAILAKSRCWDKTERKRLLLVLPVFAFNYGTALLVTSAYETVRYFFYMLPATPILLVLFFSGAQPVKNENNV